ncbi:MAG: branched-chain amino acid ABC transporter permease, partial [Spirochaetales bacterium]
GSVIAAIGVTILMEALRFLDEPMNLIFFRTEGLPGLRMVVFSLMLMIVVIFRQRGLMGGKEFSWDMLRDAGAALARLGRKIRPRKGGRNV